MSEELQKEIDALKAQLTKAGTDLEEAKSKLKDTSHEARDRRLSAKTLEEQLESLKTEHESLKGAAAKERETWQAESQKRDAILRSIKHEQAFNSVAEELKVKNPAKKADLYHLAQYKSDSFEPEPGKIREAFASVLRERPWLLDEDPKQAAAAAKSATGVANGAEWAKADLRNKPAAGSERGQTVTTESKSSPPGRIPGRL